MSTLRQVAASIVVSVLLAGCGAPGQITDRWSEPAKLVPATSTTLPVETLPAPERPVDVAVYAIPDSTGQHKTANSFAQFSRAVTQGADDVLVDVLKRAGNGQWFRVVERSGLANLVQERQLIESHRQAHLGDEAEPLPPLRFAGIIIEGGIIDYDSNQVTGGTGARYLGIGGDMQHRRDVVTVSLRTVSVSTGEVLAAVTTTKTIYSQVVRGHGFSFVAVDGILEAEAGFSRNEPVSLAVRQGIELAVYALVMEGARQGQWQFRDRDLGSRLLAAYQARYKSQMAARAAE